MEANKYQVLPLDASVATRVVAPRPNLAAGGTQFTWSGEITGRPNGDAPSILDSSFHFTADVEIPQGGAEGMILTQGGRFGAMDSTCRKGDPCSYTISSTFRERDGKDQPRFHRAGTLRRVPALTSRTG